MNISGVLIHTLPEKIEAVRDALNALPGVEVHYATEEGRMVVTIEDTNAKASGDMLVKINLMDGVLNASLVYHHFESDEDPIAPIQSDVPQNTNREMIGDPS